MRSKKVLLLSSSSCVSLPTKPKSEARAITIGMATSIHVTSIPSILSIVWPVGRNDPVDEPATFKNCISTGAALPGTPSILVFPS